VFPGWFVGPKSTTLTFGKFWEDEATTFDIEGFDLINFGGMNAKRRTQVAVGTGFRARVSRAVDLGFAEHRPTTIS